MDGSDLSAARLSRRRALKLGGTMAGGLVAARLPLPSSAAAASAHHRHARHDHDSGLPVAQIQDIIGIDGTVSSGVLDISVGRKDIGSVTGPLGVMLDAAFEVHGDLYFQPLGRGKALLNGDLALLPEETNPFIAALLQQGLTFQAFHQHLIEMNPQVWFIHFRGVGDPLSLARAVRAALGVTKTPLPQASPANPTTPLDADKLAKILHGDAQVGEEGVVTVSVNRKRGVRLGGVYAKPETGISTSIEFKPLGSGAQVAAVPDFSMTGDEVVPVVRRMQGLGWFQGCLYNQETDEQPQLYFDHMLKVGDAYALAAEIRSGLDLTDSE
jgi:hypothetical protein